MSVNMQSKQKIFKNNKNIMQAAQQKKIAKKKKIQLPKKILLFTFIPRRKQIKSSIGMRLALIYNNATYDSFCSIHTRLPRPSLNLCKCCRYSLCFGSYHADCLTAVLVSTQIFFFSFYSTVSTLKLVSFSKWAKYNL